MTEAPEGISATDYAVLNDLMKKTHEDVLEKVMRNATLVDPSFILPIVNEATLAAIVPGAIFLDVHNGVKPDKAPTRESLALLAAFTLYRIMGNENPWEDAITEVKKCFPNLKVVDNVNILDRRQTKKQEAA